MREIRFWNIYVQFKPEKKKNIVSLNDFLPMSWFETYENALLDNKFWNRKVIWVYEVFEVKEQCENVEKEFDQFVD